MALFPLCDGWLAAACLVALFDGPIVILNTIIATARQTYAPADILGRVAAAGRTLTSSLTPAMMLGAGYVAESVGVPSIMIVLGGLTAVTAMFIPFTRVRELQA